MQIMTKLQGIKAMRSTAKFVLIVEKEATFQHIAESTFVKDMNCIMVTGKGYPDANSRQFVKMLYEYLKIPLLALVDGDAHGIDIMFMYRYGSKVRMELS